MAWHPDSARTADSARTPVSARTRSIRLWQLALAAVIVVAGLVIVILAPSLLEAPTTAAGVVVILALTVATLLAPWHRFGRGVVLIVPFIDILAIGLLAYGGDVWFAFLWVFPLAWCASFFRARWVVAALALVAVIVAVDALARGLDEFSTLRFLVVLLSLTFISITIHLGARRTRAFTRLLRRRTAELEDSLEHVRAQRRRTRQLLDGLDSAVAQVDAEGRLLAVNDAYVRLYGVERADLSRPPTSVEYDSRGGAALPASDLAVARGARGERLHDERLWLFDADGAWHVAAASTRPLTGSIDEPATALLVIRDITDAVEAEAARRSLATTVTHELANPLTAIVGYTDLLLEDDDLPPRARERLELIDAAGARMERLIGEVLRAGGRDPHPPDPPRPLELRALLAATVDSLAPAAAGHGVALTLASGPEVAAVADAFRLRQVFDNLVGNAVAYSPGATVDIEVTAEGADAVVTITDTGIGIGEADLPHVFDDYARAQTARDAGIPGTGLGMGISRAIIAQHGGTIALASTAGRGTTVTVRLPRRGSAASVP